MGIKEDLIQALQYQNEDKLHQAEFLFKKVISTYLDFPVETYLGLGLTYEKLNKLEEAIEAYRTAIKFSPKIYEAYINMSNIFVNKKEYKKAADILVETLKLESNAEVLNNIGLSYSKAKKYKKSIYYLKEALKQKQNEYIYNNIAHSLIGQGNYKEAKEYAKKALELNPEYFSSYVNLGTIYEKERKFKKVIKLYKKALKLDPKHININTNLSFIYFHVGNFTCGFKHYEYRLKKYKEYFNKYLKLGTLWNGKTSLNTKSILIFLEQGFGDNIQFIKYIKKLKDEHPKSYIILFTQKELISLFSNLHYIDEIVTNNTQLNFNYILPLLSIPYTLKLDPKKLKSNKRYIKHKKSKSFLIVKNNKKNIGICWKGSGKLEVDNRSIQNKQFFKLLRNLDANFYNLQIDLTKEDKYFIDKYNVIDYSKNFNDFNDTANLISKLDLIITIDTSVAHLSGALGINTFILLCYNYDWRWEEFNGNNLWYKSIKTFKQDEERNWEKVISEVENKLKLLLK